MIESNNPLVSVVMPVYNSEFYLVNSIKSILEQTFSSFEFFIIDDGSTDRSLEIISDMSQIDERINLIKNEMNLGVAISLNKGIAMSKGKYIVRMDADDISLPRRLEEQVKFMEARPEVDVLGTGCMLIDKSGVRLRDFVFPSHSLMLQWDLPFFTPLIHPSVMMRSSTIKKIGGYDPQMKHTEDYDLWWRVSLSGGLANLQEIHLLLRSHGENVSVRYQSQQEEFSRRIGAKYMSLVLERDISEEVIEHLRGKHTTASLAALAGEIILDYCGYCIQDASPAVSFHIIKDAWTRVARKIFRFAFHPVTWKIWKRLLFFEMFMPKRKKEA